ncbi:MAG: hypothetical protein COA94_07815 [Rickettsiales bacterium]|nr:MAG: hypothetical protein COA94_07815 [Rickettsiales bacterium]
MNNLLEIKFIANSARTCFNPSFPIIHIKTKSDHNAWIHIVRTDAAAEELRFFIDTDKKFTPFYNFNEDFYDAPFWYYGIFNKPLSFWEGHAYAVKVDHDSKTITCMGGIKWGFKLQYFSLKPKMIDPISLSHEDWKKDWLFFSKSLTGYTLKVN